MNRRRINVPNLPLNEMIEAARQGRLVYEKFGPSDGYCDRCGKYGWSYLVAIAEPGDDLGGHIQNAERLWSLGPDCFESLARMTGMQIKPFRSTA